MATLKTDLIFAGISGRLGNLIFRQINGRTFVSARPRPSLRPPTPAQLEQRKRFAAASRARAAARRLGG